MAQTGNQLPGLNLHGVQEVAPSHLQRLLATLETQLAAGEAEPARLALRDCLGFMIRFFAFVGAGAVDSHRLSDQRVERLWQPGATVSDSRELLLAAVEVLESETTSPLARAYRRIFYDSDGELRDFAADLGFEDKIDRVSSFCGGALVDEEDSMERMAGLVEGWLANAKMFLQECDYQYESSALFGQKELTIGFREHRLRTKVSVRLREARPSLKLEPEPDELDDLGVLVSHMLEQRKGAQEAEEAEPKIKPVLGFRSEYIGYGKNPHGKLGHTGKIHLFNAGDGELEGIISSTNPGLNIIPRAFKSNQQVCTFWLDPDCMPQPEGFVEIEVQDENRRIPIASLLPRSRISSFGRGQLAGLLMAPPLVGLIYLFWVYWITFRRIELLLREYAPNGELVASDFTRTMGQGVVGIMQLHVQPRIESATVLFLLLSVLSPLVVTKIFRLFPKAQKRDLGWVYCLALVLPTVGFLSLWNAPIMQHELFAYGILSELDFRTHFPWFAGFNLFASLYLFLSVTGVLDRWFGGRPLRVLLSPLLFLMWLSAVGILVYARSWLS